MPHQFQMYNKHVFCQLNITHILSNFILTPHFHLISLDTCMWDNLTYMLFNLYSFNYCITTH